MIALRFPSEYLRQARISARVRPQPTEVSIVGSKVHILTQGEAMAVISMSLYGGGMTTVKPETRGHRGFPASYPGTWCGLRAAATSF